MAKTILITGGAGFIGSNFIRYWLRNHPEDTVLNLDALTYAGNLASLADVASSPNYTFIEGNICDRTLVNKIAADVDLIVHFAAESHVDRSITNPSIFLQTNVIGTGVLLDAAVEHKVSHFHHISTDEVFGTLELGTNEQFSESTKYDPRSPYSASKAASDHLVRAYGETYGLPFTITNCSNNYGEYHYPEKLIPLAITNLMQGKTVPVYGDGLQVRDWLYVQDHCKAIDAVISAGPTQETFLVGGLTEDIPNLEVVKMIINLMGESENKIEFVEDRAGHDRRYSVDWSKINQKLGWSPEVTFEEGLEKTIKWYQQNEHWWQSLKQETAKDFS